MQSANQGYSYGNMASHSRSKYSLLQKILESHEECVWALWVLESSSSVVLDSRSPPSCHFQAFQTWPEIFTFIMFNNWFLKSLIHRHIWHKSSKTIYNCTVCHLWPAFIELGNFAQSKICYQYPSLISNFTYLKRCQKSSKNWPKILATKQQTK